MSTLDLENGGGNDGPICDLTDFGTTKGLQSRTSRAHWSICVHCELTVFASTSSEQEMTCFHGPVMSFT